MDRNLIMKVLGKKDSVDLHDQIYNLREITDELREVIVLGAPVTEEFIIRINRRLNAIYNIIQPIKDKLEDPSSIVGYTNSKMYLMKYIDDLCINIKGVLCTINPFEVKGFTQHSNILMDLVLAY